MITTSLIIKGVVGKLFCVPSIFAPRASCATLHWFCNQVTNNELCSHWLPVIGFEPVFVCKLLSLHYSDNVLKEDCQSHMCGIGQFVILFLGSSFWVQLLMGTL
jgi:hypothetical protein